MSETEPDPAHHITADETDDPADTDPRAAVGEAGPHERGDLPEQIPDAEG